jgi:hypothetical protein
MALMHYRLDPADDSPDAWIGLTTEQARDARCRALERFGARR